VKSNKEKLILNRKLKIKTIKTKRNNNLCFTPLSCPNYRNCRLRVTDLDEDILMDPELAITDDADLTLFTAKVKFVL
jgi:hypothetical protein